jgi:hypothetical protein
MQGEVRMTQARFLRTISILCAAATLWLCVGCGTILYPERRGQRTAARVDAGVAVMDGLWCLLIIPGIIAFAVDFSNGAIYLPAGAASNGPGRIVKTPNGRTDEVAIERTLRQQTGLSIHVDAPTVIRRVLSQRDDVARTVAEARQDPRAIH